MDLARSRFTPRTLLLALALLLVAFAGTARASDIQVTSADGGSGTCPSADQCTLREAVEHANTGDVIHVPAFHIHLGGVEIYSDTGNVTIVGAGARSTFVDGDGTSRVFDFDSDTTLRNLTVTGGDAVSASSLHAASNGFGGAISNNTGATLTIDHVAVTSSQARTSGGGIGGSGDLNAQFSLISGNTAGSGQGGGDSAAQRRHVRQHRQRQRRYELGRQ